MSLLEIEGLAVSYGAIRGLHGISLHVDEGEVVTLIGANGAGKSTTLRAISGMVPFSGSIRFAGRSLGGLRPDELVALGLVHAPEGRGIFANLTVAENLALGAFQRKDGEIGKDRARVIELFPRLGERIGQSAGTLSGGEQQMLAIGRALMARPKLLLLDEPSLGLAPQVTQTIFKIIREINASGTTILLVEQNAHMALGVARRAYVLETGEIATSGDAKALAQSDDVKKHYLGIG